MFPSSKSLLNKFFNFIQKSRLIKKNDHLILGISGGPDSLALFHLLFSLQEKLNYKIHLAHLNHQLRGKASEKDEKFVCEIAAKFNLPLTVKKQNVAALAEKSHLSIEEAGRNARFDFFLKLAKRIKANKIALAHNADDQVETFLMRLLRGSGLRGLAAMSEEKEINGVKVIRPLLYIWRKEIESYLKTYGLNPRFDASNKNKKFLRNRVRLELIPFLKKYNPQVKKILKQTSGIFSEVFNGLCRNVQKAEKKAILKKNKNRVVFDIERLFLIPKYLLKEVLKATAENLVGQASNISFLHVNKILEMILSDRQIWQLNLPHKLKVLGKNNLLIFSFHLSKSKSVNYFQYKLKIRGNTFIPELNQTIKTSIEKIKGIPKTFPLSRRSGLSAGGGGAHKFCLLDFDKIKLPIYVRNRRTGDRFQPFGMRGTKKLQDFFVDKKVPLEKRDEIPLVISKNNIIWVSGYTIDENFKITPKTISVLKLSI